MLDPEVEILKNRLGDRNGGHILDIACGDGAFMEVLLASFQKVESFTALDIDDFSLEQARKRIDHPQIRFIQASALEIPFGDDHFDTVSMAQGLHHLSNDRLGLREMYRVLKPGGLFILKEMHRDGLSEAQQTHAAYHHLRAEVDTLLGISHNETYTGDELMERISELGLKELQREEYTEDPGNIFDQDRFNSYSENLSNWLQRLEDSADYDDYARRMAGLKKRMFLKGVAWPPKIIFTGTK